MRLLFRIVRAVVVALLVLVAFVAAAPGVLYLHGSMKLPEHPVPADPEAFPEIAFSLL